MLPAVTDDSLSSPDDPPPTTHRRRPRYSGKNPRRFEDKYKEHDPARHADTVTKVLAAGKTPAGTHRPIMVAEILEALAAVPAKQRSIAHSVTAATPANSWRASSPADA